MPEDRQRRGLVLEFSLAENIGLHDYRKPPFSRLGWLYPKRLVERATRLIREFDVRGGGPRNAGGALSGGNQQKVILAREIDRDPRVLVAAQPTRGLDVGAIEFVHRRLVEERDEGRAILLVSLELEEVLSLADRILVIYEGEFVGEFPPTATEEELGVAMTGGGKREERVTRQPSVRRAAAAARRVSGERRGLGRRWGGVIAPVITVILAFLISGVVVLLTTKDLGDTLETYRAIFRGSGLSWFFEIGSNGIGLPWSDARVWFPWNVDDISSLAAANLQQTLILWTALVLAGLAVAFAFRCGLFNIGGQGQYIAGSASRSSSRRSFRTSSTCRGCCSIVASVIGGMLAGAFVAGIAGFLKGTVGAHEVITTIMLNWIVDLGRVVPLRDRRAVPDLGVGRSAVLR